MSSEEHLAFGQRLPEMLLAQGAGLWPKGQDRDSWSSGTAHCPPSEGRFAASVLLIPTLDSGSRSLGLFPCSSSSPDTARGPAPSLLALPEPPDPEIRRPPHLPLLSPAARLQEAELSAACTNLCCECKSSGHATPKHTAQVY